MPEIQIGDLVAVTGASGFVGSHCVSALLDAGFKVRAVVRDATNETKTAHLKALANAEGNLTFASGDLMKDGSFDDAFTGVDAVMHTAAVVLTDASDAQKTIVDPSVKGTENVLGSITKAGCVKRIVHTSSIAAILNADQPEKVFTEADFNTWSNVANGDAYGYAKVTAEKMVTDYVTKTGGKVDAVSINPCVIAGPCMTKAHTKASPVFIRQLLFGNEMPDTYMQFVDVREVAAAHVAALSIDSAAAASTPRFIIAGDAATHGMRLAKVAETAQGLFPKYKITHTPEAWWKQLGVVRYFFASEFQRAYIANEFKVSSAASVTGLGTQYRPFNETLTDTIASMVDSNFVKARAK